MWTTENPHRYNREHLRYPSDLTDDEWAQVEHLIPPAKRGGRRRKVDVRKVLIDPNVPVPAWPLSPRGRERMARARH